MQRVEKEVDPCWFFQAAQESGGGGHHPWSYLRNIYTWCLVTWLRGSLAVLG